MLLVHSPAEDHLAEGLTNLRRALELNPNDVENLRSLGWAEIIAGNTSEKDYAKALEYALVGTSGAPSLPVLHIILAVTYVGLGDVDKARGALETARGLAPEYVQARLDGGTPNRKPEHKKRFTAFVRIAAGLEDPSAADALR